jgi:5-methylcytosine-specific restriction protein A
MASRLGAFVFMPLAAPKPCMQPGCKVLATDGTSRCMSHKVVRDSFGDKRRGTRHERGYGSAWSKARIRILRRDAGICQPCQREGHVHRGTEVDHVTPKAEGGTDDDGNLQTICTAAHRAKTQAEAARGRGLGPHQGGADGLSGQGGGGGKSGPQDAGTDPLVKFSCAQVMGIFS